MRNTNKNTNTKEDTNTEKNAKHIYKNHEMLGQVFGISDQKRSNHELDGITIATHEEASDPSRIFGERRFLRTAVVSHPHLPHYERAPLEELTESAKRVFGTGSDRDGIHLYHLGQHPIGDKKVWCCIAGEYRRRPNLPFTTPKPAQHTYGDLSHLPVISTPPAIHHREQVYLGNQPETLAQLVISVSHTDDIDERNWRIGDTARGFFSNMPFFRNPSGIYVHEAHPHTHTFESQHKNLGTVTLDIGIAELYRIP